ncbi:sugar ABC transporter substrate-binding protein [Kutzneria chonburiensis]|uniref:Sugar ABC transporter substrate-binding protein n=1 Tax=Kutzneria chonburiensis TaxID=1483604 RepID=A0ABV6MLV5_9PSEU|nr:sugar ABC transporter substrate-binding protein [Kutzneria chonburiensis]
MRRPLIALCAAAVVATACTATPKAETATTLGQAAACDSSLSQQEVLAFKAPKAKKPYKISLMEVSLAGYYYQANVYGAEQAAKDAGVTLTTTAGQGYASPALQVSQVDSVLARDPDAIVLFPSDINGSVPVVDKAKARQVPVVVLGTQLASKDTAASVIQDDYTLGKIGADQLAQAVPQGGPGILIAGPGNATWSLKRVAGFQDELKAKYPNLKVVAAPTQPVDPAQGLKDFTNAAQANPGIKWVYSVYYYQLLPESIPAQFKGIPFITTGYEPTAIKSLQNNSLTATASVQNVKIGYLAVARAVSVLNGDKPPATTCLPAPTLGKGDIGSPTADADLYPDGYTVSASH